MYILRYTSRKYTQLESKYVINSLYFSVENQKLKNENIINYVQYKL